jgi:hypothetical protein
MNAPLKLVNLARKIVADDDWMRQAAEVERETSMPEDLIQETLIKYGFKATPVEEAMLMTLIFPIVIAYCQAKEAS